ncbi:MAG: hypothetical protein ACI9DJ_001948, partial [Algoriphagus sp.]
KATIEGVVLAPSLLAMTTGSLPSITATQEFVVPKSIPIIFPMLYFLVLLIQNHVMLLDEQSICQGETGNIFVTVCQE